MCIYIDRPYYVHLTCTGALPPPARDAAVKRSRLVAKEARRGGAMTTPTRMHAITQHVYHRVCLVP